MRNDFLLAYGSLLNTHSREVHSGISGPLLRAVLLGWGRAWCATYPDEGATYAGALADAGKNLDVVLIPTQIDAGLQQRERGYRFKQLHRNDFEVVDKTHSFTPEARFFVCESLQPEAPSIANPLPQSYVDTCLLGCHEVGGEPAMQRFVEQTSGWQCTWVNDRDWSQALYPRGSRLSRQQRSLVDRVLQQQDVLQWRQAG